jgi:hypothetical protein
VSIRARLEFVIPKLEGYIDSQDEFKTYTLGEFKAQLAGEAPETISHAVSTLCRRGQLIRVAYGVYQKGKSRYEPYRHVLNGADGGLLLQKLWTKVCR